MMAQPIANPVTARVETLGTDPFAVTLPARPYPGLRPFEIGDWPIFFGREAMTAEVIDLLARQRFLVVHGDSGCGKSSLIRAGVQAQLEQEQTRSGHQWIAVAMRPGDAPLWSLAEALAHAVGKGGDRDAVRDLRRLLNRGRDAAGALGPALGLAAEQRLCLLVDQFEELFRFAREGGGEEARLFTDCLVGLEGTRPPGLYLILTMRSEFMGHCARYEGLAEAVNRGQYLLPRMDRPALVRAIREPARLYGGEVDPALAGALIADAGGGQDQLPLVQHGLMLLWDRSQSRRLTLADYRAGTGLTDLLSNHADSVMEQVAAGGHPTRRMAVEHLFRALTDAGVQGRAVRHPQSFGELKAVSGADEGVLGEIIDAFRAEGVSFLTPYGSAPIADETRIDIAHEALIRCWRRIGDPETGWLKREFQDGLTWQSLRVQAEAFGRDPTQLLSAAATLELAAWIRALPSPHWTERYGGGLAHVQRLLDASEKERQRDLAESEERRRLEVRQRLLTRFIAIVTVIALLAVSLGVTALVQYFKADAARLNSETESALLALKIQETRLLVQAAATATSPDGTLVASVAPNGRLSLLNLNDRKPIPLPPDCGGERTDLVVFSPNGARLATASLTEVWVMDSNGTQCRHLQGHVARVRRVAFSSDAQFLATGDDDGTCRIWDAQRGVLVQKLSGPSSPVVDVAFDPSGQRMIAKWADGNISEWLSPSGRFDDVKPREVVAAVETQPTIFVHIRSEGDRQAALAWQGLLRAHGASVPGIELVGERAPARSELRFFHRDEKQQATQVVDQMSRGGATVQLKYTPGYEVRPLQFEVWFADNAIGYWFPVVGSFKTPDAAFNAAGKLQGKVTGRYDVQVYAAFNARGERVYAVTLGGYMTEKEARARVAAARTDNIHPEAYAWESRGWGENLWAVGAGG